MPHLPLNVHDQLSVIIRYVNDSVQERLLAFEKNDSGVGQDIFDKVNTILQKNNINIKLCVGSSTDGAANMQGQYKGFKAWLEKEVPGQVHVWCYAHILNLVIGDTTKIVVEAINLFGDLNASATFVRESYLRMGAWEKNSKSKYITQIGETRWWSKDYCLSKVFGSFNKPNEALYVAIIKTFKEISFSEKFNPEVRSRALNYLEKYISFKFITTAHIFLRIFESTTPLSNYLQTKGISLNAAYAMVSKTLSTLQSQSRDFDSLMAATKKFISWAVEKLDDEDAINIETTIPARR